MPSTEWTFTIEPPPLLDHRVEERPGHGEDVEQVDVVHRLPRLGRRLLEADERPVVADVVHQHVDVAVLAEHGVGQPRRRRPRSVTSTTWARAVAAGRLDVGDGCARPARGRSRRSRPGRRAAANSREMAPPMPSPPPVTTATLPSSSRFQSSIGGTSVGCWVFTGRAPSRRQAVHPGGRGRLRVTGPVCSAANDRSPDGNHATASAASGVEAGNLTQSASRVEAV